MNLHWAMKTSKNVGPRERVIRIGLGSAALLALLSPRLGRWRWLVGAIGLANVVLGAKRYCPTNALLGIDNTRGEEMFHFTGGGRARRWNRWQRRVGATV
jgi:hypothetical protein